MEEASGGEVMVMGDGGGLPPHFRYAARGGGKRLGNGRVHPECDTQSLAWLGGHC